MKTMIFNQLFCFIIILLQQNNNKKMETVTFVTIRASTHALGQDWVLSQRSAPELCVRADIKLNDLVNPGRDRDRV